MVVGDECQPRAEASDSPPLVLPLRERLRKRSAPEIVFHPKRRAPCSKTVGDSEHVMPVISSESLPDGRGKGGEAAGAEAEDTGEGGRGVGGGRGGEGRGGAGGRTTGGGGGGGASGGRAGGAKCKSGRGRASRTTDGSERENSRGDGGGPRRGDPPDFPTISGPKSSATVPGVLPLRERLRLRTMTVGQHTDNELLASNRLAAEGLNDKSRNSQPSPTRTVSLGGSPCHFDCQPAASTVASAVSPAPPMGSVSREQLISSEEEDDRECSTRSSLRLVRARLPPGAPTLTTLDSDVRRTSPRLRLRGARSVGAMDTAASDVASSSRATLACGVNARVADGDGNNLHLDPAAYGGGLLARGMAHPPKASTSELRRGQSERKELKTKPLHELRCNVNAAAGGAGFVLEHPAQNDLSAVRGGATAATSSSRGDGFSAKDRRGSSACGPVRLASRGPPVASIASREPGCVAGHQEATADHPVAQSFENKQPPDPPLLAAAREQTAAEEVSRILPLRKESFFCEAAWGFAVLRLSATSTQELQAVQSAYRALMKKLHPDRVGHSADVANAIEALREARDCCERSLSRLQPPGAPRSLTFATLSAVPGRRRVRLDWVPPITKNDAPVRRYLVAALDPAYGRALTVATLEPDYQEDLGRYVTVEELRSHTLAEEALQKMPSLFRQSCATFQVAAANEAGQSPWSTIRVSLTEASSSMASGVAAIAAAASGTSMAPPSPAPGTSGTACFAPRGQAATSTKPKDANSAIARNSSEFEVQLKMRRGFPGLRSWLGRQCKTLLAGWLRSKSWPGTGSKEDLVDRIENAIVGSGGASAPSGGQGTAASGGGGRSSVGNSGRKPGARPLVGQPCLAKASLVREKVTK